MFKTSHMNDPGIRKKGENPTIIPDDWITRIQMSDTEKKENIDPENTSEEDVKMSKQEIVEIKKMDRSSQLKKNMLITGIASAVLGAILLFWPGLTMELICQFLGAALGITGLLTCGVYFTQPKETPMRGASLAAGIPLALLGLFIFLRPSFLIEFIPVVIGVIILIDGTANLLESINVLRHGDDRWWVSLIFAILTLLSGLLLIMRPFGIAKVIMRVIGAVILYNGLSDIFIAMRIRNKIKDV